MSLRRVGVAVLACLLAACTGVPERTPFVLPSPPEPESSAAVDLLLQRVPSAFRARCTSPEEGATGSPDPGQLAEVRCEEPGEGADTVLYRLYQDEASLDAAYGEVRRFVRRGVGPELTGTRCQDGNYDGTWAREGVQHGKLICVTTGANTEFLWSDTRTGLLGLARNADRNIDALFLFWSSAVTDQ
jgi:hypothetical protein